jgi:hypothetical protein
MSLKKTLLRLKQEALTPCARELTMTVFIFLEDMDRIKEQISISQLQPFKPLSREYP